MDQKQDNRYVKWGLTALTVVFISILLVVIFTNLPGFFDVLKRAGKVLSPLMTGAVIAFLLNPLVNLVDGCLRSLLLKKKMKLSTAAKLSRTVGVLFAFIFAAFLVYGFFSLLLPQLYDSVMSIWESAPGYYAHAEEWVLNILEDNPEIQTYINVAFDKVYEFVENWINTTFLRDVSKILSTVTTSVMAVVKSLTNFLIGLVASIYILFSKEKFQAQAKKLVAGAFSPARADRILYVGSETNRVLNGFVIGKLLDSAIIGVLCYIGMVLLKLPYAALLSTIVGITNVIPVFGPVIGMLPGALILLLVNPLQAFYFVIFVIVLQQIDGNVIGPKILGNTVGLSGFWVLVSITIAASLFGVAGMLLGVPVFAIIYSLVSDALDAKLKKREMTQETDRYYAIRKVEDLIKTSETAPAAQTEDAQDPNADEKNSETVQI
ncbi:MAG: AI-2E family transporter [Clostridia bacterium]|nr:AI-2E family transporter [Clostridia bacterium]